jgi:hypothetical protein
VHSFLAEPNFLVYVFTIFFFNVWFWLDRVVDKNL